MYISRISEFAKFISENRDRDMDEILATLVKRTLVDLEVTAAFLSIVNKTNEVQPVSHFGFNTNIADIFTKKVSIFEKYPITDSIRKNELVSIATLPIWGDQYSLLNNINLPMNEKTFICLPIDLKGSPAGVIGFFALPSIDLDLTEIAFLEAIIGILSLHILFNTDIFNSNNQRSNIRNNSKSLGGIKDLSERQNLILKLIAEGRTNIAISEILGYSESTIRQESIKIYSRLGCKGRSEATALFLSNSNLETSEA